MLVKVKRIEEVLESIKPGDEVTMLNKPNRLYKVLRLVETPEHIYAVFDDWTWRPVSSYGRTWAKVDFFDN